MTQVDVSLFRRPILLEPDNFTDQLWGGDWIPRFKGLPASKSLVGESWEFSARAERPTMIRLEDGTRVSLADVIKKFPKETLGARVASRFGASSPILIKLIDARDDLSVQVHPSDDNVEASRGDCGKSEAWFILESEPGEANGYIYVGFDEKKAAGYPDREIFESAFFDAINQANAQGPSNDAAVRTKAERLILPFLNKVRVKPGEIYELRPGTIHAIGRGVRLFEVQQASDLTYRVWDWNRPDAKKMKKGKMEFRELHLKEARRVLDFQSQPIEHYRPAPVPVFSSDAAREDVLIVDHGKKFAAHRLVFFKKNSVIEVIPNEQFQVVTVINGEIWCGEEKISKGRSVLLPGGLKKVALHSETANAEAVRSYVPI